REGKRQVMRTLPPIPARPYKMAGVPAPQARDALLSFGTLFIKEQETGKFLFFDKREIHSREELLWEDCFQQTHGRRCGAIGALFCTALATRCSLLFLRCFSLLC